MDNKKMSIICFINTIKKNIKFLKTSNFQQKLQKVVKLCYIYTNQQFLIFRL